MDTSRLISKFNLKHRMDENRGRELILKIRLNNFHSQMDLRKVTHPYPTSFKLLNFIPEKRASHKFERIEKNENDEQFLK